ncbi:hypothetical protein [Sneathiella chinensis]|uniref:Uncharacterized protein n=1 Tax=Sneathiella chinensis TaxID=349750 RepID=A0ABQ5U015_9PROT|nr:hypothetical protein [Sneathiella chinensis]GLQ05000.1 hypothetical protein GCM10007924_02210 [Sneathiella chinensis]
MQTTPSMVSPSPSRKAGYADPIIDQGDVNWAARKFILLFGEDAADWALREVTRLELEGKLHVAEMFHRVASECARLLQKSEKLRIVSMH